MILAYSTYLGGRLDFEVITKLGIKNTEKAVQTLINTGLHIQKTMCFILITTI